MARKCEKKIWTVERKYKNLYSPFTCVQSIIRRHIAWEGKTGRNEDHYGK